MTLLDEQLRLIMPRATRARRSQSLSILNDVMEAYEINNEQRAAAWLATLAVESGELKYQQEIASGAAYEGRKDLGNTEAGDGKRFKGHGRIQLTGRFNHQAYTDYLRGKAHLPFVDFIENPKQLAEEPYATDSAGWFWAVLKNLNPVADKGQFLKTQIAVNGRNRRTGLPNHWDERKGYYERALAVLSDELVVENIKTADPGSTVGTQEADKGVTTGTQPASEIEGTPPPAKASEIKASRPSLKSTAAALVTAVMAPLSYIGIDTKQVGEFAKGNVTLALKLAFVFGLIVLACYIWNRAMDRANQRTLKLMTAASDQDANNLRLV